MESIGAMCFRITWIEFDCTLELPIRTFPVPIAIEADGAKREVRMCKVWVELKCLQTRTFPPQAWQRAEWSS